MAEVALKAASKRFGEVVAVDNPRDWFEGRRPDVEAFIMTAEAGYAWTLQYPAFQVVIPLDARVKMPHAFAVADGDLDLAFYLDSWASLMQKTGELDELYAHWILGEGAEARTPRWSVIRNLLDVSQLESGGRTYRRSALRIDELVRDVVGDYEHMTERYGIDVDVDLPGDTIRSDAEMLWHLFSNLISNAIKFRKKKGPARIAVTGGLYTALHRCLQPGGR